MTYYAQMIHRTTAAAGGDYRLSDEDSYADWSEEFATLEEAESYARAQAAQAAPRWEPKPTDTLSFGVWPYGIERPVWEVYTEPEPDTPEWKELGGFCKVYDIIDPLEPMEDLQDLLAGTARGCGSIAEQLAFDLGDEIDICAEVAELLPADDPERQTIERRRLSLVSFGCMLAQTGRSWALLEDGRCCGLLGGLDNKRPAACDVLRADWWSASDCDMSTAQGKEAAVIYSIIADVVSWR